MKIKMTILAVSFITTSSFGQLMSYLTSLKTSDAGITVAEISLIHRSRSNYKDIRDLGSKIIMIPNHLHGQELKIESYRFWTRDGTPFEMDGTTYIPVHLYYDTETSDPRDDIFISSLPFPVETELVLEELSYFGGAGLITSNFKQAPKGESTVTGTKVSVTRKE